MKLIALFLVLFTIEAQAMKFKVRAREHFETHKIDLNGTDTTYKGLSNTINLWWEMPYELSYGFYFNPVLAGLEEDESNSPLGEEIDYLHVGVEAKYFIHKVVTNLYGRFGLGYSQLKPDNNGDDADGYNVYLGLGYEYPFKNFGLALEAGYRYADLSDDVTVTSFTPSIGFHFYEMF